MKILMQPFWMILLFVICLSSCKGPVREEPAGPHGYNENILRFDVARPFMSLNPSEAQDSGSTVIFPLFYSFLCVPNEKGKLQPDLAESWSYDPETFIWTIMLRPDAFFHNGQRVTGEDIKYSIESVLRNVCPALFKLIAAMTPISENAIKICLLKNDPDFLKKIWDMEILCSPKKADIDYYDFPVGSGPFRFQSRDGEKQIILTANPDYYKGRPALDGVVYYYQPDKEISWARLLAGETDIVQEISPQNYEMIKTYEDDFYFDHYTLRFYSILLYNTKDPLFSDPDVRVALTHAIDRQYIVDHILKGYGKVAVGPMGANSPFSNPDLRPIPYDPKQALLLLKKAGWNYDDKNRHLIRDGRRFEFTLLVPKGIQIEKAVTRFIQLCLSEIGISLRVLIVPTSDMYELYYRNDIFQAVLTELSGVYFRPEYFLELWMPQPDMQSEAGGFFHPELVRILSKIRSTQNPVIQKEYLHQAEALIVSLQPGTFLFHKTAFDVMSRRFDLAHPFSLSHEGIHWLRNAVLHQKEVSSR